MKRLNLNQAVAVVSGFGYAVLMDANPEQLDSGISHVLAVKASDREAVGTYALDQEEARKFRLFKKVLRRGSYKHGQIVWLAL